MASNSRPPLSSILPPLIFGTATFNYQYNTDPFALNPTTIVHEALSHGIRAFDTSPYYGPSEEILGTALSTPYKTTSSPFPRSSIFLITKVGRLTSTTFNYTPPWIQQSITRSLTRLRTNTLDLVYCHDVEFVSAAEVLTAIIELRRIRDVEGTIKYVGISGYPVRVLCDLAKMVLEKTGEPLDAVMSYSNYTLQNTRLLTEGVERLREARVDVVPNASILSMGLLRRTGVPTGSLGNWHPAPDGLRSAAHKASEYCDGEGEKLEVVAIRWALESWVRLGDGVGSRGNAASGIEWKEEEKSEEVGGRKLGVSLIGVSSVAELEETMRVWRSILDGMEGENRTKEHVWSLERRAEIERLGKGVQTALGEWFDFVWDSPDEDFLKAKKEAEDGV